MDKFAFYVLSFVLTTLIYYHGAHSFIRYIRQLELAREDAANRLSRNMAWTMAIPYARIENNPIN